MKTRLLMLLALLMSAVSYAEEGHFKVAAEINGQPARLIFDTGTEDLVLYQHAAERLGIKIAEPVPLHPDKGGKVVTGLTEDVDFKFLGTQAKTAFRLIKGSDEFYYDVDGFIGWPTVRNNIFAIDGQTVTFPALAQVPLEALSWLKLEIVTNSNTLLLQAPGWGCWEIDTGNNGPGGVVLLPAAWEKWRREAPSATTTLYSYFMHGAGNVVAEVAWAEELSFGPLKLSRVPVRVANEAELKSSPREDFIGILGASALRRLDLVVDGKKNVAYVRTKKSAPTSVAHNRMGAVFLPKGSEDMLAQVTPGGPAYLAGVRDGDQLLKINDNVVENLLTNKLIVPLAFDWSEPAGTAYQLTLKRKATAAGESDRVFTVFVELKELLKSQSKKTESKEDEIHEAKWYEWLGKEVFDRRQYADAASYYGESLRLNPKNTEALLGAGLCHNALEKQEQALNYFAQALKLNPKLDAAWAGQGASHLMSGEAEKAIASFTKAVSLNPTNAFALDGRGVAYYQREEAAKSLADLDAAIRFNPNEEDYLKHRGVVYRSQGKVDLALADLSEALRLAPRDIEARTQRAYAFYDKQQYEKSLADWEELTRIEPGNFRWHHNLAWLLASCPEQKFRNGKLAVESATKACELTSWHEGGSVATLAAAYAEAGDFAEAIKWQATFLKIPLPEKNRIEGERRMQLYRAKKAYQEP